MLPFLDIVLAMAHHGVRRSAPTIVYSNYDIIVDQSFYSFVGAQLGRSHEAMTSDAVRPSSTRPQRVSLSIKRLGVALNVSTTRSSLAQYRHLWTLPMTRQFSGHDTLVFHRESLPVLFDAAHGLVVGLGFWDSYIWTHLARTTDALYLKTTRMAAHIQNDLAWQSGAEPLSKNWNHLYGCLRNLSTELVAPLSVCCRRVPLATLDIAMAQPDLGAIVRQHCGRGRSGVDS